MKIALATVPEDGLALDTAVPVTAFQARDVEQLQLSPVSVTGTLKEAGGVFLFRGRVAGTFVRACDRCLVEVRVPFETEVFWTFQEGSAAGLTVEEMDESDADGGDQGDAFTFQGGMLDLTPCVWEEVALAYPMRFVPCEERPELEFECMVEDFEPLLESQGRPGIEQPRNTGFAGLADMFPDLKPRKPED